MNSVMDDNKLLTLANGERIRLQNYCALLFEVGNLEYASPATVSRAGMVYVDPKNLGYIPFWQRWLVSRSVQQRPKLQELFQQFVPATMTYILDGLNGTLQEQPLNPIIPQTNMNLITQLCNVLDATLATNLTANDSDIIECGFIQVCPIKI
jgi:dynein heavy chain, axonemal